jgi:hypothetical protein
MHYSDRNVGERSIEPTETVEPEPGIEFMVEPEGNQGNQCCA